MSEYRVKETGEVLSQGQLRKKHSNVSLPRVWGANVMEALGIDPVLASPKPDTTELQTAVRNGVEQDAKGNWVYAWTVSDKFSDYTNEDDVVVTKAEQEAEYLTKLLADAQEAKRIELKQIRNEAIDEPINDVQVARVEDRENINGSIELMEANSIPSMNWVLIDNTVGTLTVSDLETIRDTYVLRKMQTFAKYGELLTVLNNATTVEEVEGIQW